jgi:hypothetical protein
MAAPKTSLNPKARPRTKTEEKTLRGRPVWIDHTGEVTGEKGSKYSEVTTTIPWGTEWITAPSIDENGKKLSDDEVKQRLLETRGKDFITGEKLPTFSNPEKASEYAQWRSDTMFDQEAIEQGFPEEFPMGPEPERKDFIDRSIDKGKDFLEYLTTPSKHGVFNEGGDVGLPTNRLIYDVDDITGRGPEGKIKRDAAKKRVLEKYNLEGARSGWKVSPSKLVSILGNLPTNVRLLTEFMLGKDKPISINDFTKDELASIIALSEEQQENYKNVQNRKLKNQPENVTTVDGYDTTQPYRFSKWIENSPYFRTLAFTLTDPNYQTRTTLGRYDTEETPSSIIIKDAYDMNIKQRDLPNPFGDRKELSKVLEEVRSNPEVAGEFLANIIRPNQTDSRKFDLVIPKRKPDQPSPRDTAHQAPMQLKEKPKDNPRIKEKVPEGFDILNFNKGGIAMNEQMEMAFMNQGGLKDDGMKRDPVSGNEVPSGSMAKEVRDDISAFISEGEYVVPADVVRYLGVKHFEDLRDKAKQGLQSMEANGRIGGEPVPVGGPQAAPMMQQPQQMQPPMPQAPTPYSPQPAPPQMAMGGDLSPEEMNEINSIMMAQGGMVPTDPYQQQQMQYTQPMAMGAAEGTDVITGGFYNPGGGLTTEQTITTPGPLGGGKYTGELSTEVPQVGITETEVPVENEASCEARGMVFNSITGMCETPDPVPERVGGDGSSSTPPTAPGTPGTPGSFDIGFKNWGAEVDWTDPESVEKFVTGQYNMPDPALRKGAGVAGLLGAGPLAAVGTVGSIFMAGQVLDTVADLRTSVMIAKAYGNTEGAAIAQAKLDAALKGAPSYVTSSFGDIVAPGTRQFAGHVSGASGLDDLPSDIDAWTENDFTRFQSAVGKKAPVTPEPTRSDDDRPTVVPGTPPPSAAGTGGGARPPRRPTGDDPGPSGAEVAAKASQASTATPASRAKAMSAARQKGGVSAPTAAKLSGSQMKAGSGVGSGAGGANYAGPMNKGGLMLKKKKK